MILVQKPLTLTPSQFPLHSHRRRPSVPLTVVVLPTRTPGLLTLSKPPRSTPQRQKQHQSPKHLRKTKSSPVVRAPLLNLSAEIADCKMSGVIALPATPSPQPRGRGQIRHTKERKSPSPSYPVRGKHKHHPFPPVPKSQSEVAVISFSDIPSAPHDKTILNPSKPSLPSTPIRAIPFRRDSTSPSNDSLSEREAAEKAADYFASSMFQNSPSPEALPDPFLF